MFFNGHALVACVKSAVEVEEERKKGRQEEYDKFWDNFQNYGNRTLYNFAFWREGWTDENFYPKYDMITTAPTGTHNQMFAVCKITDLAGRLQECGVKLDTTANRYFTYMFQNASVMTHIPELNMTNVTAVTSMFGANYALKTIDKMIFSESGLDKDLSFTGCTALENIVIAGKIAANFNLQWCPLSTDSMISIIGCLKNFNGTADKDKYKITFSQDCWDRLNEIPHPDGLHEWQDEVIFKGWLVG